MKKSAIILLLLLSSIKLFSCCDESIYRLFPIGALDQQLIFIEYDLARTCKIETKNPGYGDKNEFWISGTINLITYHNDSIVSIENIDTINLKECLCNYNNYYDKSLYGSFVNTSYKEALEKIKMKKSLRAIKATKISFNDSTNVRLEKARKSLSVYYKDHLIVNYERKSIFTIFPTTITEVREYKTKNFNIIIVQLALEQLKTTDPRKHSRLFRKQHIVYRKENAISHGKTKDYVKIFIR